MGFAKKSLAAILALVMTAGLSACTVGGGASWAAKAGEMTVPAGVYIGELMNAYYSAAANVDPEAKDPLKEQVDGITVSQKVSEDAKNALASYIAVEQKFDELGLNLDETTDAAIAQNVEAYWQYIGKSYEENGISKESYQKLFTNDAKKSEIFMSIYGEGGTEEVPEEELKEKFQADYAKIIMIPINFSASEDAQVKEEDKNKAREIIDKYEQLAKDGGNMEDLVFEAKKEISSDPDSVTKPEPGMAYTFVSKDQPSYSETVMDAIFSANVGEPTKLETETSIYLFVRYDLMENENDFTSRKAMLISSVRQDAFDAKLDEWSSALTDVTYNDEAMNRYTPEKLKI